MGRHHAPDTRQTHQPYDDQRHGAGILDRTTPVGDLSDAALWGQIMAEDRALAYGSTDDDYARYDLLNAEAACRFGIDATERTASWSVGMHMSSDDLVQWAVDSPEHLMRVATGDLDSCRECGIIYRDTLNRSRLIYRAEDTGRICWDYSTTDKN